MIFDKSKVYSALNADELHAGDTVILADNLTALRSRVEGDKYIGKLIDIECEDYGYRFLSNDGYHYHWAYLVERAPEGKYVPWTKENCPLKAGDVLRYISEDREETLVDAVCFDRDCCIHLAVNLNVGISSDWKSFEDLFSDYLMGNGEPCGQKVEEV
mgnify:CR=1 FL=1